MKNVVDFFVGLGWRDYGKRQTAISKGHLFGLRIDGEGVTNCRCNEKLSLHATWFDEMVGTHHLKAVEFDITGEASDGRWFALKAYSIRPDELTQELVENIQRRLMAAWEATQ